MTALADHPSADTADGALVRSYLAGDAAAFDALFRRYRPDILRLMYGKTRDWALAEDLTQETFARALRYLETYNPTRPFWPWLRTIACNLSANELHRRSAEVPVEEVDAGVVLLADDSDAVVAREAVAETLKKLQPRHQRALIMRYVEDRDSNDIALLLGVKRNALEQLLRRARVTFGKEYAVRNGAIVPGFAAIAARARRILAAIEARINVATNATMAVASDFAIGAALTVGGFGIVAGMAGGSSAEATALAPSRPATGYSVTYDDAGAPGARRAIGTTGHVGSPDVAGYQAGYGAAGSAGEPGADAGVATSTSDAIAAPETGPAPEAPQVPKTRSVPPVDPVDPPEADQPKSRSAGHDMVVHREKEVGVGDQSVATVETTNDTGEGTTSTTVSAGGMDPVTVEGGTYMVEHACVGTCPVL
jgi:RNA polymerase sigma-70 factor (ECF subfamily)